jgi:hypothetical protein
MPIERNGKHWCDPASEEPNKAGNWKCSCGKTWTYWPEISTWAEKGVDLTPQPDQERPEVPADEEGEG